MVVLTVLVALFVFVLALSLLKHGAVGMARILDGLSAAGVLNALGFGWLMAYLSLSGSPVAATSLTLLDGGALTPMETFGMINGSRFGASFIVLFTGFVYYLRGIRGRGVVSMGVLAMVTTATTYLPAMLLGTFVLRHGWLDGIRAFSPGALTSVVDVVVGPLTTAISGRLPGLLTFAVGFVCLLLSFRLFDRVLPSLGTDVLQTRWGRRLDQPLGMFLVGLIVTTITLSVSVSLSILVPLAGRGVVRRDQAIPYIMGANISTFVDTLFAALLLRTPEAFTIVLAQVLSVAVVSLLVLALVYRRYRDALLAVNRFVTVSRVRFAVFVAIIALVPITLLLL